MSADGPNEAELTAGNFFLSPVWWRSATSFAIKQAGEFRLAAIVITASNLLAVIADRAMNDMLSMSELDLAKVLTVALVGLLVTAVALGLALWSLYIWFTKLIAFSTVWFNRGSFPSMSLNEVHATMRKEKRSLLNQLSIWSTLILSPLIFPLATFIGLKMLSNPKYTAFGQRLVPIPSWADPLLLVGIAVLTIITLGYVELTIALTGRNDAISGKTVAIAGVTVFVKQFSIVCVLSVIVVALNVLVSAPQMVLLMTPYASILTEGPLAIWINAASQVWLGILSVVLWPLSVLPFCQLLEFNSTQKSNEI